MRPLIPFGGLTIIGGAATVSLTTTAALLNLWSATGGGTTDTTQLDGNYSVQPDAANNRIKVMAPGVFEYSFRMSGTIDGTIIVTSQARKNATTVIPGTKNAATFTTSTTAAHSANGIFSITSTDNLGTLLNFPEPSTSGYVGAGGSPKDMVPIDIVLTGSGSQVLTIIEAVFRIVRIG